MTQARLRSYLALAALSACSAGALAQGLSDAQRSAIKSACRGDYMQVCSSVPTGTQASLQCLVQHASQVSTGCQGALAPAMPATPAAAPAAPGGPSASAAPAAAAPPAAAPAAPAPMMMRSASPRAEARVLRNSCGSDFQKFCSGVQPGGGRGIACLRDHAADLTPGCKSALQSLAAPP